ncbi:hypothetical protein EMPS_06832 [Entomortierella parvispora]|uniref:DNA 3'-5' helicase n=2 Tax=Entomortierella parvispora TaxID=205924 RepID=A0A9P3HBV1_9FUNG|nr:hypothetical protein EMPS_04151 [Entomortierella parvispora]GJJ72024.1 hypothetical protein EMPS_04381 [Entomortierella parvispora]GJJ72918.1 hypothetical protein EMPS_05276 [Entomortierella parvispora]GJJ73533.1 hypothetical protein EMPS_05891 [Entomortierella parvispora]GJJ74474.1 hypothetical protein EMPS_06832 [Entomortierella parvispora]
MTKMASKRPIEQSHDALSKSDQDIPGTPRRSRSTKGEGRFRLDSPGAPPRTPQTTQTPRAPRAPRTPRTPRTSQTLQTPRFIQSPIVANQGTTNGSGATDMAQPLPFVMEAQALSPTSQAAYIGGSTQFNIGKNSTPPITGEEPPRLNVGENLTRSNVGEESPRPSNASEELTFDPFCDNTDGEPIMTWGSDNYYVRTPLRKKWSSMQPSSSAPSSPANSVGSPLQSFSSPSNAVLSQPLPFIQKSDEREDESDVQDPLCKEAIQACRKRFHHSPKEEQLRVVKHIYNKQDCLLLAPCGWGKTLVFSLPMVMWKDKITVVISPLIALMQDQIKKLKEKDVTCLLLSTYNGNRVNDSDIKLVKEGHYRAVFMSPEVIFGKGSTACKVQDLWNNKYWKSQLCSIVVDEVHCVDKWKDFRPYYSQIGSLRGKVPGVPIVGLTATLPPDSLQEIKNSVFLASSTVHVIRVDDIRDNIQLEVHTFSLRNRVRQLAKLLDNTKTIVYFDSIALLRDVQDKLRPLRPDLRMDAFFSTRLSSSKDKVLLKFINSEIDVLLATDACGMGCDISDVITVFQYDLPHDLTSLVQRFGRAARGPGTKGFGILLAPPTTSRKYNKRPDILNFVAPQLTRTRTRKRTRKRTRTTVGGNVGGMWWMNI